jgi:serine/threonine-protein kinase
VVRATELVGGFLLSVSLTVDGLVVHGIEHPMVLPVLVLLFRSLALAEHWRRGRWSIAAIALAQPLSILLAALVSPRLAAELGDPVQRGMFLFNQVCLGGAAVVALVGGHFVWAQRQQLYQARALGRFRLLEKLGAGGMGEVWLARHHALKQDVAVKLLRPDPAEPSTSAPRFEREARATADLNHPNIVRVFDYGLTDDGLWFYAMEYLPGIDLGRLVRERGPLDARTATGLALQAARGLAEAHARGIVHRDVKPENLVVVTLSDGSELVKVVDFGLARRSEGEATRSLTATGIALGTPLWISPEVVRGEPADARSDVYGLGAVLYFLLCGEAPFAGRSLDGTLLAHLHEAPPRPSKRAGRPVPHSLEQLILRCLDKRPERRFASARELAAELERESSGEPASAAAPLAKVIPLR